MRRCCRMLRAEMSSIMELVPLLCLFVLSCSGSTSAAGAEPERIAVKKGNDVILPCSISGDITLKRFEWKRDGQKEVFMYDAAPVSGQDKQFIGRVSHFSEELKKGNASITIRNTTMTDTGSYTCESPLLNHKILISLLVAGDSIKDRSRENITGTASKPSISTLDVATNWALLRCEVHGELIEPVVQWTNSKGENISNKAPDVSEDGGKYTVVLETEVTESGKYSCIATQEEISHQIAHSTVVSVPEPKEITVTEGSVNVILPCSTLGDITSKRFEWKKDGQEVYVYNGSAVLIQHEQFKGPVSVPGQLEKGNASIIIRKTKMDDAGEYTCEVPGLNKKILIILHVDKGPETPARFSTGVVVGAVGGVVLGICVLLAVQKCRRKMKSQSNSG